MHSSLRGHCGLCDPGAGEVYTYGANESGQLGCRGRTTQCEPVQLDSLQSHVVCPALTARWRPY